jgi:hypothetical protein
MGSKLFEQVDDRREEQTITTADGDAANNSKE